MAEDKAAWVQRQIAALIALGDTPLDAQRIVQRVLRQAGAERGLDDLVSVDAAHFDAQITDEDIRDAQADWYASEDVPTALKRLLDAQARNAPGPFREGVASQFEEAPPRSLLQSYIWDETVGRYRYMRNGQFVARSRIMKLLSRSISQREERIAAGTRALSEGAISSSTFVQRTELLLKRQYLQNAALGVGGWERLTPEIMADLEGRLETEFGRVIKMSEQLAKGEISQAQALNRTRMYLGNARAMYFTYERQGLGPAPEGFVYLERRTLGVAEHCIDCVTFAQLGWQPLGTLPVPGAQSSCDGNCRCEMERELFSSEDALVLQQRGLMA